MNAPNVFSHKCSLCQKNFSSRNKLLTHERNNLFWTCCLLSDAFIVLIKKRLGFNRHSISSKWLSIDAFPETIFVHLFGNEPTFRYRPTKRKYYCQFQGKTGEERLKQILNYEYWNVRQNPKTNTTGYVLFVNYMGTYNVNFSWYLNIWFAVLTLINLILKKITNFWLGPY